MAIFPITLSFSFSRAQVGNKTVDRKMSDSDEVIPAEKKGRGRAETDKADKARSLF